MAGRERRRIGEVLTSTGVITEAQLQEALAAQSHVAPGEPRKKLGAMVIELGMATERQIAEALAEALALPLVDLGRTVVVPEAVRSLPRAVAERAGVLVTQRDGGRLTVATADPTNVLAIDDVKLYTGASEVHVVVALDSQVRDHLARAWSLSEDASDVSTMFEETQEQAIENDVGSQAVESAPIVKLVDVVLADAVRARASDIHVEPQAGDLRIRYRVDGLLRDVMTVPRSATAAAVSRIKIVSGLDIAERRKPQDGRAKITVDGVRIEARISTLPTLHGEKVVIRLLPPSDQVPAARRHRPDARAARPAGDGAAADAGARAHHRPHRLGQDQHALRRDPAGEHARAQRRHARGPGRGAGRRHHAGAGAREVRLTFAAGLRSVLRQDPDIVLVGEVRDTETAELAMQASLTGHLVLTTLHTNDAVAAITRLVDMGVPPFLVASSLSLVVAQRLVRTPCSACKAPYDPSDDVLARLGVARADLVGATPTKGRGCVDCGGTGYRGRQGVFEVLPVTAELRAVLMSDASEAAIATAARKQGHATLRTAALAAAGRGETTYEEVLRATTVDASSGPRCPSCARSLADDMQVCPFDGALLHTDRCRGCEKTLQPDWTHCPWCRAAAVLPLQQVPAPR